MNNDYQEIDDYEITLKLVIVQRVKHHKVVYTASEGDHADISVRIDDIEHVQPERNAQGKLWKQNERTNEIMMSIRIVFVWVFEIEQVCFIRKALEEMVQLKMK